MQLYALANVVGDYCWYVIRSRFSLARFFFFSSMNVSQNKNHNDFRSSIFNHFLCCMFCCCFFLLSRRFFSLHSYWEGRKSYFFSLFFVFSFDHNSQKTPTHLMMYQYSDSNLEWNFFTFFIFSRIHFWIVFFYILLYRCVRDIMRKYWENSLNFDNLRRNSGHKSG